MTLTLCAVGVFSISGATAQALEYEKVFFTDVIEVTKTIETKDVAIGAGVVGVLAAMSILDEDLFDLAQDVFDRPIPEQHFAVTNRLGGPMMLPATATLFAGSLLSGNPKFQNATFTSMQAVVYAGVTWTAVKAVVGRARPRRELGAHSWSFSSEENSFPSGHTATAFAAFTPLIKSIDRPWAGILYLIPASTGIARIQRNKHWPTDVVAGALTGYLMGRVLHNVHARKLNVSGSTGARRTSIRLTYNFRP